MFKTAILHTGFLAAAMAVSAHAQSVCSNATVKSNYGVQVTGMRPAPTVVSGIQATPGTTEQVVGVVIQIFDGAGGFTQTDNVKGSLSGITADRPSVGTYSVNPDCTGTYTVNNPGMPPIVNRFVATDNGQTMLAAVVSPQAVLVTAIGHKMTYLASCPASSAPVVSGATDPNGSAAIAGSGTIVVYGQGFTPAGGNTLVFQRSGSADVVLSEGGSGYYWDYSSGQINAALTGLLASGTWNLTVRSACSAMASNSLAVTIR